MNIHRQQAVTKEGLQRFKLVFPKSQKDWVVKPMYEKKSYDYLEDMLEEVLYERQESHSQAPLRKRKAAPQPEAIASNIARSEKPRKADIITRHRSRMGLSIN